MLKMVEENQFEFIQASMHLNPFTFGSPATYCNIYRLVPNVIFRRAFDYPRYKSSRVLEPEKIYIMHRN